MGDKKKMNLDQYILCTVISRKILDIVLEQHPEIVTKAIQRTIEEDKAISDFVKFVEKEKRNNATIQQEDNPTNGLRRV